MSPSNSTPTGRKVKVRRTKLRSQRPDDQGDGDNDADALVDATAERLEMQEVSRPDAVRAGRLRLVQYPLVPQRLVRVEAMKLEAKTYWEALALPLAREGKGNQVVEDSEDVEDSEGVEGSEGKGPVRGALYGKMGRLIADSERGIGHKGGAWHSNKHNLRRSSDQLPKPTRRVEGSTFFLGHWSPGFGHVLLELLPRLWHRSANKPYDNYLVYPRRMVKRPVIEMYDWLEELLALAGVPLDRVVVVRDEPTVIERVTVTTQPFVLKAAADPRFLKVFNAINKRVRASGEVGRDLPRRVYLSRSQVRKRTLRNEEDIERAMEQQGLTVVHPQTLSIAEQVAMMSQVELIAGGDGSALHMAAFARPGTKLLSIDSRAVMNQFLIDQARGLDAVHYLAVDRLTRSPRRWVADVPRISEVLDQLRTS